MHFYTRHNAVPILAPLLLGYVLIAGFQRIARKALQTCGAHALPETL